MKVGKFGVGGPGREDLKTRSAARARAPTTIASARRSVRQRDRRSPRSSSAGLARAAPGDHALPVPRWPSDRVAGGPNARTSAPDGSTHRHELLKLGDTKPPSRRVTQSLALFRRKSDAHPGGCARDLPVRGVGELRGDSRGIGGLRGRAGRCSGARITVNGGASRSRGGRERPAETGRVPDASHAPLLLAVEGGGGEGTALRRDGDERRSCFIVDCAMGSSR